MAQLVEITSTGHDFNERPEGGIDAHYHDFSFNVRYLKDSPLADDISEHIIRVVVSRTFAASSAVWQYNMPGTEKILLQHAFEYAKEKIVEGDLKEFEELNLTQESVEQNRYDPTKIDEVGVFSETFDLDEERRGRETIGFKFN